MRDLFGIKRENVILDTILRKTKKKQYEETGEARQEENMQVVKVGFSVITK